MTSLRLFASEQVAYGRLCILRILVRFYRFISKPAGARLALFAATPAFATGNILSQHWETPIQTQNILSQHWETPIQTQNILSQHWETLIQTQNILSQHWETANQTKNKVSQHWDAISRLNQWRF
jgi:hypothetical protein